MLRAPDQRGVPGVRNFHKVDSHIYRGGQPTSEGMQNLAKLGIKTVVGLRDSDIKQARRNKRRRTSACGMYTCRCRPQAVNRPARDPIAVNLERQGCMARFRAITPGLQESRPNSQLLLALARTSDI